MEEMNKYGTRLVHKTTGNSRLLAITSPKILEENFVFSEAKDSAKRKKFSWTPMDDEWKASCADIWWFKEEKDPVVMEKQPRMYELRDKLLSFGGESTCFPYIEEDLEDILDKGQFWFGDGAKMMKGAPSQCHRNCCELYDLNKDDFDVRICTGYALSEKGGMWRQHSWLVLHNPRSNQIIETTEPRIGYYGFVMTREQCDKFCEDNLW